MFIRLILLTLFSLFTGPVLAQCLYPSCQQVKSAQLQLENSRGLAAENSRSDSLDVLHYDIRLDLSDMSSQDIGGNTIIHLSPKLDGIEQIILDLQNLPVSEVLVDGETVSFEYETPVLKVSLAEALTVGSVYEVDVYYEGNPTTASFGGFYTSSSYFYNLGVGIGIDPPTYGRAWFPCVDNFVEKSTYECHIRTSGEDKAFCGGLLVDEETHADGDITWSWQLDQEIPTYLASVAVAKYETLEWTHEGMNGPIPVQLGSLASDTANFRSAFVNLGRAVDGFETAFGPYPFDRIGFVIVPFNGGAMEHATNVAYPSFGIQGGGLNYEDLMAHEFAHHWWGNYMTCERADEMWLNEGWASFCALYFFELAYDKQTYKEKMRAHHRKVALYSHRSDGDAYAVSGVPFDVTYGSTVYEKGADVIHSLRGYMGDIKFFHCTKEFLAAYGFRNANSEQFRDFLSDCSGQDMGPYFDAYIFNPGYGHFSVHHMEVTPVDDKFRTTVNIRQKLRMTDSYHTQVPLELSFLDASGEMYEEQIVMSGGCMEFVWEFDFEPVYVGVDIEEKINDATVDQYEWISDDGEYNWRNTAGVDLNATEVSGEVYYRAVNNLVHADRPEIAIQNHILSEERYWTIEIVKPNGSDMTARLDFHYNGANNNSTGNLDPGLFSEGENKLKLFYRPDGNSNWTVAENQTAAPGGSALDKIGFFRVTDAKAGEYALAIEDPDREETISNYEGDCEEVDYTNTDVEDIPVEDWFHVYPNPATDRISFVVAPGRADYFVLRDAAGALVAEGRIEHQNNDIVSASLSSGVFVLELLSEEQSVATEKVIVLD